MAEKVADYLKVGAILVGAAEPTAENVIEHRSGQSPKTYGKADTLTCEDVIPGFRLPLADLFQP